MVTLVEPDAQEIAGLIQSLHPAKARRELAESGLCREINQDVFFAEKGDSRAINIARKVCQRCDVRPLCLALAIRDGEPVGIWGGLAPVARRNFAKSVRTQLNAELVSEVDK